MANKGNPTWIKGGPSPNPLGRAVTKASSTPPGSDGVYAPGGFYYPGVQERDPKLIGAQKWVTYDNTVLNTAIVASAVRAWVNLGSSVKWHAEKNPRGGKNAEKMVDIVTEGLIENTNLSAPWTNIVKLQHIKSFKGFAMHAHSLRRRKDGVVVFGDIQHRPQWTAWRWIKPDEDQAWTDVEQRTRTGRLYVIPREELFYSVDNLLTSNPEGVGLLRHLVEAARIRDVYVRLEGIGLQTDLNGMPVGRAPMGDLAREALAAGCTTPDQVKAFVAAKVKFLEDLLSGHNKTADQYLMLDSSTYTTRDTQETPSSVFKWAFDVVRASTNTAPVAVAIMRLDRELARVMCAEWLMLGDSTSGGNRALSQSKTDMFGLSINAANRDIGADGTRDLCTRLTVANGGDPDTDTPKLVAEPVATSDVEAVCRSLLALSQAALAPDDEARNVIRARMDLPPEPERDPSLLMIPRPPPGRGMPPNITTKPNESATLNDVPKPEDAGAGTGNPAAMKPPDLPDAGEPDKIEVRAHTRVNPNLSAKPDKAVLP